MNMEKVMKNDDNVSVRACKDIPIGDRMPILNTETKIDKINNLLTLIQKK